MNYTYSLRNPYLYEYSLGSLEVYSFGYGLLTTFSVDADYSKSNEYFGLEPEEIAKREEDIEDETERMGILPPDKLLKRIMDRPSDVMNKFLESWEGWRAAAQ